MNGSIAPQNTSANKIVFGLVILGALIVCSFYLVSWYCSICVRSTSINFEGPIIWAATELARGHNIYPLSSHTAQPWIAILYPPLYMLVGAPFAALMGDSYIPLRIVSALSGAAAALLLFRIFKAQACSFTVALAATAFYFSFAVVVYESAECRPDMLSVALGMGALYAFVSTARTQSDNQLPNRSLILPVVLSSLSIFAKQQGVVYPLAITLCMLVNGRYKSGLLFAASWLGLTASLLLATDLISGGLLANMSLLKGVHSRVEVLTSNFAGLGLDVIKVLYAVILAPIGILMQKKLSMDERLPLILFCLSAIIMCYTMGIPASNVQHTMPALLGLCWWVGLSLRKMPSFICVLTLSLVLLNVYPLMLEQQAMILIESRQKQDIAKLKDLHLEGKPLLTDDVYLNLLTDSKPVFVDCASFINLWKDTGKGFDELTGKIARQEYPAIVINEADAHNGGERAFWPAPVIASIKQNYVEKEILFCGPWIFVLFVPKQAGMVE